MPPAPPSERVQVLRASTEPGTPVRLFVGDGNQGFSTSVLGVDDGRLVLAPVRPAHGNLVLERLLGEVRLELVIAGLPHGARTRVHAVTSNAVIVELPSDLERIQRRRYFRVRAPGGLHARLHFEDGVRIRELLDLSGGGCALLAQAEDADLVEGSGVPVLQFALGDGRAFSAPAVVRRTGRRDGPWGRENILGVEFPDLPSRERYQLIAWVTERERSMLRVRTLDPVKVVPDVVVLFHDAPNVVRLRPGAALGLRSVRVRQFDGEPALAPGAEHPDAEVRVGGELVFRAALRCERADLVDEQPYLTFAFPALSPEARARLAELLRP